MTVKVGDWVRYVDALPYFHGFDGTLEVAGVNNETGIVRVKTKEGREKYFSEDEVEKVVITINDRVCKLEDTACVGTVWGHEPNGLFIMWDNGLSSVENEKDLMVVNSIFDPMTDCVSDDDHTPSFDIYREPNRLDEMRVEVGEVLSKYRTPRQADGLSHYMDFVVEPLDLAYLNNLDPAQLKVMKYTMRHKTKDGAKDIRKAIDILNKILEYEYGEKV